MAKFHFHETGPLEKVGNEAQAQLPAPIFDALKGLFTGLSIPDGKAVEIVAYGTIRADFAEIEKLRARVVEPPATAPVTPPTAPDPTPAPTVAAPAPVSASPTSKASNAAIPLTPPKSQGAS